MTNNKDIKFYANLKITETKTGEIEISAEVPAEVFDDVYEGVIEEAMKEFEAPGFRKGKAPKELFMQQMNQARILEEAASEALKLAYPQILADEELEVISNPEISITKLAPQNPMAFTAKVAITPKIKLPDYTKLSKKVYDEKPPEGVTDDEVRDVLKRFVALQNQGSQDGDKKEEDPIKLLTDDFVKSLGPFTDVENFLKQVRKDLAESKKSTWKKDKREALAKELIEASSFELSPLLLSDEWERHQKVIQDQLARANVTLQDYTKQIGMDEKDFLEKEKEGIEKQLRVKFILREIAKKEDVKPDDKDIAEELEILMKRYSEADPIRAHAFVEESLRNEAVLKFLEKAGGLEEASPQNNPDQLGVDVGSDKDNNDKDN